MIVSYLFTADNEFTDRSKAVVLVWFLLMFFFYYFVIYLYVNGSGSIPSVGEERADLSPVVYL